MTLSATFRSLVHGRGEFADVSARLGVWRDCWSPAEVSFPASILGDKAVSRWIIQRSAMVDVRTFAELNLAVSAGIDPSLITVHCSGFDVDEIRRTAGLAVGRVVVGCEEHIDAITGRLDSRTHNVMLRIGAAALSGSTGPSAGRGFPGDSPAADLAAQRVITHRSLTLIGLHAEIGCAESEFVNSSAAIGCLMAELDHIRRRYGLLLTRLSLGTTRQYATDADLCHSCAIEITDSIDDACAVFRFPRPVVSVCGPRALSGQCAL